MESYIHLYETNDKFTEAYNGPDYKEPWLSLTEENNAVNYNKPKLTAIAFGTITWVTDVPATGGTATKENCTFEVYGKYDNGTSVDISSDSTVTGELIVAETTATTRQSAGTLTLTASYSGLTATGNVTAYQAAVDFSTKPLTFNILSAGTINWVASRSDIAKTIEYKLNDGEWASITSNTDSSAPTITVKVGDKLQFRGNNERYATSYSYYNSFNGSTASFEAEGNIMSLIYGDDFKNKLTISSEYAFLGLFEYCVNLVSAENLVLPATTLANWCYYNMFYNCTSLTTALKELPASVLKSGCYYGMFYDCTSLTTAPALPATKLADSCYSYMFSNCTSLTTAPELPANTLAKRCYSGMFSNCTSLTTVPSNLLPATTLADSCYSSMFNNCTSLTTAPALPATTLVESCYSSMFRGCTSLTTAPALPATTLVSGCYSQMFSNCTSLTIAPELPATTLANYCYSSMFSECESLNYIKCLATNISATNCTYNWVGWVASTGTFVKNPNMESWTTGASGIPTGWTVQNA